MKSISFKDFFQNEFFTDRQYVHSGMSKLFEMATPFWPDVKNTTASHTGDVAKKPVNMDNEDIDFLYQFPPEFWIQAIHARYGDDLYEALALREKQRKPRYEELTKKIQKALLSQNFNMLQDTVSRQELRKIKKYYGQKWAADYADNLELASTNAAKEIAYQIIEREIPNAPISNEEKVYYFKMPGAPRKNKKAAKSSFTAHSHINRLIHKLERTKGQPHDPRAGLAKFGITHGQYGYDLYAAKEGRQKMNARDTEIPHSTQGMQMVSSKAIYPRIRKFLAANAHGIFGQPPSAGEEVQLPNGETTKIIGHKPIRGKSKKQALTDIFIDEKYREPLIRKYYRLLNLKNPFKLANGTPVDPTSLPKFASNSERRSKAEELTKLDLEYLKRGDLRGPPIPGHETHAGGIPFSEKQIVHLPHFRKKVKDGRGRTIDADKGGIEMPFVFPATFFRKFGSEDIDYEHEKGPDGKPRKKLGPDGKPVLSDYEQTIDADGNFVKKLGPDGQPILKDRRGYLRDYVAINDKEYESLLKKRRKKGLYAVGGLSLNQNTPGRGQLEYGHASFARRRYEVFGPDYGTEDQMPATAMKKINFAGNGPFYDDIINGIKQCLESSQCGEANAWERSSGFNSIEEIHQIVVMKMLQNLKDPEMMTSRGRKRFAKSITTSIMQQDHDGGGTRRKRRTDPSGRSTNEHEFTTLDVAHRRFRSQGFGDIGNIVNRRAMAGIHKFPYRVDEMRKLLDSLRNRAKSNDVKSHMALEDSRRKIGEDAVAILANVVEDKKVMAAQIFELLKMIVQVDDLVTIKHNGKGRKKGKDKIAAEASEILKSISLNAHTSSQLVADFSQLPLVKKYIDPDETHQPMHATPESNLEDAMEELWQYLRLMPHNNKGLLPSDEMRKVLVPEEGENISKMAQTIAKRFPEQESIAQHLQQAIDKALVPPEQAPEQAPEQEANPSLLAAPQPTRQKPVPLQASAPALAARSVDFPAAQRAKIQPNWKQLSQQKDYLALAFHNSFLTNAKNNILEQLRQIIIANFNQNEDEVKKALFNIDAEIRVNNIRGQNG